MSRKKSALETHEHVFSMCPANMPPIKERHDEAVKRLVKAIPIDLGTVYLDQRVPGAPDGTLQPDIVILNDAQKKAHLVDVACPYETQSNLKASRERKLSKYAGLKSWLEEKGDTQLDA